MSCHKKVLRCCEDPIHVCVIGSYPLRDDEGSIDTGIRGLEFAVLRPGRNDDDWEPAGFVAAPGKKFNYEIPSDGLDGDYFFKFRAIRNAVIDPSCGATACTKPGHWFPEVLRVTVIAAPPAAPPRGLVLAICDECAGSLAG